MTDFVTWVCAECDNPDVFSVWECQWDNDLQLWVGKNEHTHQEFYCDECSMDGSPINITERPLNLKEIAQVAINKQEKLNASNAQ